MATTRSKEIRPQAQQSPVRANFERTPAKMEVVKLPFKHNSQNELDGPENPYGGKRVCLRSTGTRETY